jgi:hypothetical protein
MMERDELEKMPEAQLKALARARGVEGAEHLTAKQLIERLAERPAAEPATDGPSSHTRPSSHVRPSSHTTPPGLRPQRAGFDVPSSTVHPHADELETLTMARRYAEEGQLERAVEIYEKLVVLDGTDEVIAAELVALRKRLPTPTPHAPPPPPSREPMWMLDLEELPEIYGVDECEVLFKDPFWVFAYWEVTDGGIEAARAQLGPSAASARLVLRLFTTTQAGHHVDREVHDIDLHGKHGRRYLPSVKPGAHLRVAVGLLSVEGYFAPITHSSLQRIPHAEPAPPGPVEWMEVIPSRSRGRLKEPLVIVRRSAAHTERGLGLEGAPEGGGPPGSSPVKGSR